MFLLLYALTGVVAGLLAGLLGLGGGLVVVPALLVLFSMQDFASATAMHMAVATSLATIVITSLSSIYGHQKYRQIDWKLVARLIPVLLLGAMLGALLASNLDGKWLRWSFALYALVVAIRIWLPMKEGGYAQLISPMKINVFGTLTGVISALIGIGGGTLIVPYLCMAGYSIRQAIGTAAACGFPIAVSAAMGFILFAEHEAVYDSWQSGYVYWPAFLGIVSTSVLFAQLGAKLSTTLPITLLKRLFSIVLLIIALVLSTS